MKDITRFNWPGVGLHYIPVPQSRRYVRRLFQCSAPVIYVKPDGKFETKETEAQAGGLPNLG
jgi:hypothetical protein